MEFVLICLAAIGASFLTFFSGFGLGTVLMPVFAIFFPVNLAIAMTATVHLLNDIFKLILVGKHTNKKVLLRFGIPAVLASFVGAWVLIRISGLPAIASYTVQGHTFQILPVKAVIGLVLVFFSLFELVPHFSKWQVSSKHLPLGGLLSGFFGGLSGNQGALRSIFLVRSGLTKEAFIATGSAIACFIDVTRLSIYLEHFASTGFYSNMPLLLAATLSAFTGAYVGSRFLKKITMQTIQRVVGASLVLLGFLLSMGVI